MSTGPGHLRAARSAARSRHFCASICPGPRRLADTRGHQGTPLLVLAQRGCHPLRDHRHQRAGSQVNVDVRQHVRRSRQGQGCGAGTESSDSSVRLNKTKARRLLTLPGCRRPSPPTHLIRSKNGDYLRGRVDLRWTIRSSRSNAAGEQGPGSVSGSRGSSGCTPTNSTHRRSPPACIEGDPTPGGPERWHSRHVPARAGRGQHGEWQERDPRRLQGPCRRGRPAPLRRRNRGSRRPANLWSVEASERPGTRPCRPTADRPAAGRRGPNRRWSGRRHRLRPGSSGREKVPPGRQ